MKQALRRITIKPSTEMYMMDQEEYEVDDGWMKPSNTSQMMFSTGRKGGHALWDNKEDIHHEDNKEDLN